MTLSSDLDFTVTITVRDTCLCLHAQRAARALARRFDLALKLHGITSGQFSLLMALNRPAPPSLSSVAALLAMDRTTLTANLKPLERRGLVGSEPDPADRRARLLLLSEEGRAVLAGALPVWKRVTAEIEAGLEDPERLRRDLRALEPAAQPAPAAKAQPRARSATKARSSAARSSASRRRRSQEG